MGCLPVLLALALALGEAHTTHHTVHHSVHHTVHTEAPLDFTTARKRCQAVATERGRDQGGLATLATQQEVTSVLGQVADALLRRHHHHPHQRLPGNFSFWIGLHKQKEKCTVSELPLKGFTWDGHTGREPPEPQAAAVGPWRAEPIKTCMSAQCAALTLHWNGSAVTAWAFDPISCKAPHAYICRSIPGPTPGPGTGPMLDPGPATEPVPGPGPSPVSTPEPGPEPTSAKEPAAASEPEVPPATSPARALDPHPPSRPEPASAGRPRPCRTPVVSRARALSPDTAGLDQMLVECWSGARVSLVCSGGAWLVFTETLGLRRVPLEDACPCRAGLRLGVGGACVDVDECESDPCLQNCVNTVGSYRCVCAGGAGVEQGCELAAPTTLPAPSPAMAIDWATLALVLGTVLGALLLLVLLGVLLCCLLRRRRRRREDSQSEGDKMKS